jgi:hypothetical protein
MKVKVQVIIEDESEGPPMVKEVACLCCGELLPEKCSFSPLTELLSERGPEGARTTLSPGQVGFLDVLRVDSGPARGSVAAPGLHHHCGPAHPPGCRTLGG